MAKCNCKVWVGNVCITCGKATLNVVVDESPVEVVPDETVVEYAKDMSMCKCSKKVKAVEHHKCECQSCELGETLLIAITVGAIVGTWMIFILMMLA